MDILAQPAQQWAKVTLAKGGIKAANPVAGRFHQLRGSHGPKGITGEITEQAIIPVDILQYAVGIVGRGNAEQGVQGLVPCRRQIGDLKISGDQSLFQLKSHYDMGGIGHLIRINPDEAALDPAP